jgi:hypothetical protein
MGNREEHPNHQRGARLLIFSPRPSPLIAWRTTNPDDKR